MSSEAVVGRLQLAGYVEIATQRDHPESASTPNLRLLEDPLTLVGVAEFPDEDVLLGTWMDAQDALSSLIARRALRPLGPKAWDAYLLLLLPDEPTEAFDRSLATVRTNTKQFRKLIVTGIGQRDNNGRDLDTQLAPLLPLSLDLYDETAWDPFATLVERLGQRGVPPHEVEAVLDALASGRAMMPALEGEDQTPERGVGQ